MRVLIACEFSGVVRDAFAKLGHDAWSCDLLSTEKPGKHIQGDVIGVLKDGWDMMIAHPPCTYLTVAGNKWMKPEFKDRFPTREKDREDAAAFFMEFVNAPINKICIENPVGVMSSRYRPGDQVIQPYFWGDTERKATSLWLKNLPKLSYNEKDNLFGDKTEVKPDIVQMKSGGTMSKCHYDSVSLPSNERGKVRSKTFQGIAEAMAKQWGETQ